MAEEKKMAKKIKKRKKADSWKKKEWYAIVAPKSFEEKDVGTTVASDDKMLVDRIIKVPLRQITNSMNHQFIKLNLRITEVKGQTAHTITEGFELTEEFLRRNIRRRRSLIKLVKNATTSDKVNIRMTVHIFTARKIDTSQKAEIRGAADRYLTAEIPKNTFDSLIQKSVFGTLATEVLKETKTIAPVKRVEISKCKLIRGK